MKSTYQFFTNNILDKNMFCKCGVKIPEARVEILKKANLPMTCINHSTTQRVAGFAVRDHKMNGELLIADQDTIDGLYAASARNGGIVSAGVRMVGK